MKTRLPDNVRIVDSKLALDWNGQARATVTLGTDGQSLIVGFEGDGCSGTWQITPPGCMALASLHEAEFDYDGDNGVELAKFLGRTLDLWSTDGNGITCTVYLPGNLPGELRPVRVGDKVRRESDGRIEIIRRSRP